MANNIEIDVQVKGVNDLKAVNDELARSGKMAEFAGDNYDELSNATLRMVQAQKSQTSMQKEIGRQLKAGTIDQAQATRALEAHDKKLQQNIATDKELIRQSKEAIKIEERRARTSAENAKRLNENKLALDKDYAAQQAHKKAIQDADELLNTNNITLERHAEILANVRAEYDLFDKGLARSGNQFARFNESTYVAQQKLKRFASVGLQQAGYQVNDFIVQIASGQNALVAFGQQGSQLAGIFGTKGAVAGALIAGASALANLAYQAWKAKKDIKDLKDAMEEFKTAAGSYKSAADSLSEAMAIPGLSQAKQQLIEFYELLRNNKLNQFRDSLTTTMNSLLKDMKFGDEVSNLTKITNAKSHPNQKTSITPEQKATAQADIDRIMKAAEVLDKLKGDLKNAAPKDIIPKLIQMTLYMKEAGVLTQGTLDSFNSLAKESGLLVEYTEALAKAEGEKAKSAQETREQNDRETQEGIEARRELAQIEDEINKKAWEAANARKKLGEAYLANSIELQNTNSKILADAQRENELAAVRNTLGENSLEFLQKKNNFARSDLETLLSELSMTDALRDKILAAADEGYELAEEAWNIADGLEKAKDAAAILAKELAESARQAATLDKLLSKDDQSLAELRAKVVALRGGGSKEDANIAGAVAGRRRELTAGLSGSGMDPQFQNIVIDKELKDAAEAEALKAEIARLTKTESGSGSKKDPIAELKAEQAQRQALLPLYGEERDYLEAKYAVLGKLGESAATLSEQELEGIIQTNLALDKQDQIRKNLLDLSNTIASSFSDSFMSIVDGTATVKDAFRAMALDIVKHLYKVLVMQQMINSIGGAMGGSSNALVKAIGGGLESYKAADGAAFSGGNVIPFASGGVVDSFSGGNVIPFASGGVVGSPTYFGMGGGQTGLMGEAGPEAIMPLKRGPDGKLGVEAAGGGGAVTIQQNFNFSANGDESVKKLIAQAAPKIAQMTQQQIMDSRRRGGQMKAAFG
jgi:hypothetical protein